VGVRAERGAHGFNAASGRMQDLLKAGVIDPTRAVRLALQHAASVATLLVTTEAFIVDAPRDPVDYPTSGGTGHDAMSLDPYLSRR
jgi:chaperonin GroEL